MGSIMRRPNLRFLSICVAIAAFVIITAHFVHGFQTKRTSKVLLVQARELRDKGNFGEAAGYYQRYVQLAPEDTDALAEYGLALAELPKANTSAIMVLEQVLRRKPDYPDVQRRLATVDLRTGRFSDAHDQLQARGAKRRTARR